MPPASASCGGVRRFVDISVPRNVASGISKLPGCAVYNVDDLKEVVSANKEERQKAAGEAEVREPGDGRVKGGVGNGGRRTE